MSIEKGTYIRKIFRNAFWLDIIDLHVIMDLARQSAGVASTRSGVLTKKWPSAYQGRTAIFMVKIQNSYNQ